MGWSVGYDERWKRDIGYGVPATCDYPGCGARIDRGLSHVCCGEEPYGGDGCGLYFCERHHGWAGGKCSRCHNYRPPFKPTPDIEMWTHHKMTDPSWAEWRKEHNMKEPKCEIFKVEAEGDTLYIKAVDKKAAQDRLTEVMGPIPASMLRWSSVEKLPKGEELL